MKSYGDGADPRIDTGDIEEQQVAQHRRDRSRSGMVVARLKGLTKSPRLCAATFLPALLSVPSAEPSPATSRACVCLACWMYRSPRV